MTHNPLVPQSNTSPDDPFKPEERERYSALRTDSERWRMLTVKDSRHRFSSRTVGTGIGILRASIQVDQGHFDLTVEEIPDAGLNARPRTTMLGLDERSAYALYELLRDHFNNRN
jgi:hypothetical protein